MAWVSSLVLVGAVVLFADSAHAQYYPVPREREVEPVAPFETALRLVSAERYDEAVEAFETAARTSGSVPVEALRGWGLAASEAGRPLAAYVRLRQYLSRAPFAADRAGVEERVTHARDRLLDMAAKFSRVFASIERRPDDTAPGERQLARVAARDGEVSVEGMSGLQLDSPVWRRAEEIPLGPYLGLVRRLLDAPALVDDLPVQAFDANAAGPRRAAVVRVVIAEEERRVEALRDEPYERVKGLADAVMDFARSAPAVAPEPDPKPSPRPADRQPLPKQRKSRR